jgi:predicted Zn-dependent protease
MVSKLIRLYLLSFVFTIGQAKTQSIKIDDALGKEGVYSVINEMGLYEDEELTAYVNEIGQRMVAKLQSRKFDYHFYVVDAVTPNAFALPGGYVFVTRGLLALVNNTSELACILGHEIIHVHNRHSVKQIKKGIIPSLLEIPGKLIGLFVNESLGAVINTPITTGKKLYLSKYSRTHEYESDQQGVAIAAMAGFDPTQLGGILNRIISWEETLTQQEEQESYFSDHPYTPDRVARLESQTAGMIWQYDSLGTPMAMEQIDGLMFWDNPSKGIFNDNTFMHHDLNFRIVFPIGWETANKSIMISATDPSDGAFVHLSLDDSTISAKKLGQEYGKYIKEKGYRVKLKGQKLEVNGEDAYLLRIVEKANRSEVYIYMLWVKMHGMMFKVVGVSVRDIRKQMEKVALSLRPLSEIEQSAVKRYSINIVAANNESLAKFSARNNNLLSLELLAKMNGLKNGDPLTRGQLMKIVVQED